MLRAWYDPVSCQETELIPAGPQMMGDHRHGLKIPVFQIGVLELHTCMGPECRADPHCKQAGSNELLLDVFAARRSRKGTERSLAGTERKLEIRRNFVICLALSDQAVALPFPPLPPPSPINVPSP